VRKPTEKQAEGIALILGLSDNQNGGPERAFQKIEDIPHPNQPCTAKLYPRDELDAMRSARRYLYNLVRDTAGVDISAVPHLER
jgi:hypothetical protein